MNENNTIRSARIEIRIAMTLSIMVTVFLLSMVPGVPLFLWAYLDTFTLDTNS